MSQINPSGNATVRTALASKTPRDVAAYARGTETALLPTVSEE